MLLLAFKIGEDRYALDTARVLRVLPLPRLKQVPHAPKGIAGLLTVQDTCVPVIDLAETALGRPVRRSISTRLILTTECIGDKVTRLLGIIVEKATGTLNVKREALINPRLDIPQAPYLGAVLNDEEGLVQLVAIDRLLTEEVRSALLG